MNIIIYIIIIITVLYLCASKKIIEPYWDITPYIFHWDIFKCLDMKCLRTSSYECNKWCDVWAEPGGRENCRLRCSDYADIQADNIKYNTYNWYKILPYFDRYALYNQVDYVLQ